MVASLDDAKAFIQDIPHYAGLDGWSEVGGLAIAAGASPILTKLSANIVNSGIAKFPALTPVLPSVPHVGAAVLCSLAARETGNKLLEEIGKGFAVSAVFQIANVLVPMAMKQVGLSGILYSPMSGINYTPMGELPQLSGMGDGYTEAHKRSKADFGGLGRADFGGINYTPNAMSGGADFGIEPMDQDPDEAWVEGDVIEGTLG